MLITLFAVLLLAVGSVASARMMAPDENTLLRAEIMALGLSADDICGETSGHEYHCPFCHLTPETALPVPVVIWRIFTPASGWRQSADLYRAAQAREYSKAPRGPPEVS